MDEIGINSDDVVEGLSALVELLKPNLRMQQVKKIEMN